MALKLAASFRICPQSANILVSPRLLLVAIIISGIEIHPKGPGSSSVVAINAGGPSFTDSTGKVWVSDAGYYNTGKSATTSASIGGTSTQQVFQSERYDVLSQFSPMVYSIPLVNGYYDVVLFFAENFSGIQRAGQRVFGVKIEGQLVLNDLDVFAEAGGRDKALVKTVYGVSLTDGTLDIEFVNNIQNPKVSVISQ